MLKQVVLLFAFFFMVSFSCKAQEGLDVNKDIDLIEVYDKYAQDGYGTSEIFKKLANGYYFKSNYKKAKFYFERLFEIEKPTKKQLTRYKQTLRALKLDVARNPYLVAASM